MKFKTALSLLLFLFLIPISVYGAECRKDCGSVDECKSYMNECSEILGLYSDANLKNRETLDSYKTQVSRFETMINSAGIQINKLEEDIASQEEELGQQQNLLGSRVRRYYIHTRGYSTLGTFLTSNETSEFMRSVYYQQQIADNDKRDIEELGGFLSGLIEDQKDLKQQQEWLAVKKKEAESQVSFLAKEVAKAEDYINVLSSTIATLSAKQKAILAEKEGTFQTTVGDVPLADDPASRPDYNPGFSPAFAVFSFGAPHFNGLSQYGAYGRAMSGQNAETILYAYYGNVEIKKDYDQNTNICVGNSSSSCVNVPLETYAKRIYEMPGSWGGSGGMEALKAQAVAARSYALNSMARNGYICSTESCQVYKSENKGGSWDEAVNATAGWVMMKNGKPLMAKYASTAGGYIDPYTDSFSGHTTQGFWDTANGKDGWTSQAYEKIAGSPWFYKAWYKTRSGDTCGRNHPWLTSEEMADILNAWVALYEGGGDSSRVTPESSCWGGNPYSKSDLVAIGGFTSVSGVSVQYSNSGVTASVIFQTNKGSKTITGSELYKAFNLRAPGNISIKSGLFNIEMK